MTALRALAAVAVLTTACAPPPAPPTLPEPLPVPTWEQKLAAMVRLEDQRLLRDPTPEPSASAPLASPRVPADLVAWLDDVEPRVRRRAALAVGRVGLPQGVDPLVRALADRDPEVRQMAAFALGLIGDTRAVPPLAGALEDADPLVQGRAAQALGALGHKASAPAIAGLLGRCLRDEPGIAALESDDLSYPLSPRTEAFRLGVYALVRLGAWEPFASALLDAQGRPSVRWWPVAYAAQRFEDTRALPALLSYARGEGVEGVVFAARGLGQLRDARGVEALLPLVEPGRRDRRVVATAVRALGQIGDPRAVPVLLAALSHVEADDHVRLEAVAALGAIGSPAALERITDLVSSRWPAMRAEALGALAAIDPPTLLLVLSGRDADPHWSVRASLAPLLARLEPQQAWPLLKLLWNDTDVRVKTAALEALVGSGEPGAEPAVIAALGSEDVVLRATAARLVGERKLTGAAPALLEALQKAASDETYVARASMLAAVAALQGARARGLLVEALEDRDWAMRRRAEQLLATIDPAAMAVRPAPTRLARAAYEAPAIVAPRFSPLAFVETSQGRIEIELAILDAPLTVQNFVGLAARRFFDGVGIHRVVPAFVVQDGDPRGDGEGGPGYSIRDEINDRPYLRGTVGMALDWADTGGSQFFITLGPQPHLDARYTVFGRVVGGMDVVDRLKRWDTIERVTIWDGERMVP